MSDRKKNRVQLIEELEALRRQVAALEEGEKQLWEELERHRSIEDNIIDGIVIVDECGIIEAFNPAAEKIFGYAASEAVGQKIGLLMSESYHGEHDTYIERYLETGDKKIIGIGREVTGRRQDGTLFPMDLAVGEFRLGGRRFFTGLIRDISERKRLEAQLVQAQKMESIGQLAGGIAHDFNNQLGIILFDVDMLIAAAGGKGQLREDLQKIRKVVLRASDLTRKLLLFSRRQPLELRPLELNRQLGELQKMLERLLGDDIHIDLDLGAGLWTINADAGNIDQVIINLALNARDAMPQGGVLRLETDNVEIEAQYCRRHSQARPGRFARLSVSDSGTGMSEEVKERLFEPFFTTKKVGKGTGLGLSVVYGIVQSHQGWIGVESAPGEGTRFEIYLPALEQGARVGGAAVESRAPESGGGERILVVEDEPELRQRVERVLGTNGYRVHPCGSLSEARKVFHREEGRFDLILCDIVLPDGRGPDMVYELRDGSPALGALLITVYTDEHLDWKRLRREGIPVLQKPFAIAELLAQVRAQLQQRR